MLAESLSNRGIHQHATIRCPSLAEKLSHFENLTVGPLVKSPITAYCVLPAISIAHLHDTRSMRAGLLLALARSTPFIATCREASLPSDRTIIHSAYRRASSIVCTTIEVAEAMRSRYPDTLVDIIADVDCLQPDSNEQAMRRHRIAADYVGIYRRSLDRHGIPAILV